MVAVSSPPMGTSRWTTSTTVTSGTCGGAAASFALQAASRTPDASAARQRRGQRRKEDRGEESVAWVMAASWERASCRYGVLSSSGLWSKVQCSRPRPPDKERLHSTEDHNE